MNTFLNTLLFVLFVLSGFFTIGLDGGVADYAMLFVFVASTYLLGIRMILRPAALSRIRRYEREGSYGEWKFASFYRKNPNYRVKFLSLTAEPIDLLVREPVGKKMGWVKRYLLNLKKVEKNDGWEADYSSGRRQNRRKSHLEWEEPKSHNDASWDEPSMLYGENRRKEVLIACRQWDGFLSWNRTLNGALVAIVIGLVALVAFGSFGERFTAWREEQRLSATVSCNGVEYPLYEKESDQWMYHIEHYQNGCKPEYAWIVVDHQPKTAPRAGRIKKIGQYAMLNLNTQRWEYGEREATEVAEPAEVAVATTDPEPTTTPEPEAEEPIVIASTTITVELDDQASSSQIPAWLDEFFAKLPNPPAIGAVDRLMSVLFGWLPTGSTVEVYELPGMNGYALVTHLPDGTCVAVQTDDSMNPIGNPIHVLDDRLILEAKDLKWNLRWNQDENSWQITKWPLINATKLVADQYQGLAVEP